VILREINADSYGEGWMMIVRPAHAAWRDGFVTGPEIAPAFRTWLTSDAYKSRAG
jgi:glycine cleavage system H lipoate-binding protein